MYGRLVALTVAVLVALVSTGYANGAAQEATEIPFTIAKFTCETDPGAVNPAQGLNLPDDCDPTERVAFTVTDQEGNQLATCVTDADGLCNLMLPQGASVTVREDVVTAPAGFAPRENPITTEVAAEFAGALFINLPQAEPPDETPGDTFDLPITKLECTSDPGQVRPFGLIENPPEGCTFGVGVSFTVTDADGTVLGSCTTPAGPPPTCHVTVPVPSTVVVTEDVSTAALGFAPRENPITVEVEPATEASAIFVNLSQPDLPETGAGTAASARHTGFAALLLGGLSFAFAVAGYRWRRLA